LDAFEFESGLIARWLWRRRCGLGTGSSGWPSEGGGRDSALRAGEGRGSWPPVRAEPTHTALPLWPVHTPAHSERRDQHAGLERAPAKPSGGRVGPPIEVPALAHWYAICW